MNKYEQLIEFIINEDEAKARELFHSIVVEKSREIYESLIDEEDLAEVGGNEVESMVDEITSDEEGMDEGEEFGGDDEGGDDMGGDDVELDGGDDMGGDDFGGDDMGGEGDIEDRVMDLEDALDELKAEFDALMGQEAGEPEHADMGGDDMGGADLGGDDFGGDEGNEDLMYEDEEEEDDEEEVEESIQEAKSKKEEMLKDKKAKKMTEAEWIREYVEKIGDVYGQEPAKGEGNEVGNGGKATVTPKSIVAGKNDMGGTTANIAKGGTEQNPDNKAVPQPNNQYSKGKGNLPGAGQFKNVPGGNAGKTSFKTKEGEYSTERGAEGQTTDGKVSVDKKSILKRIGK